MRPLILAPVAALALAGCAHHSTHDHDKIHGDGGPMVHAPPDHAGPAGPELATASASILGADGRAIGTARFAQGPVGMLIRMEIAAGGLAPGWHGLHLHETGDCSDTGIFQRSGGHHGKEAGAHGLMNPDAGPEPGDLPNLWAAADGSAGYEAFTLLTELVPALSGDGLSIIIHANPDDHRSQPTGGAGPRVACGMLTSTGG